MSSTPRPSARKGTICIVEMLNGIPGMKAGIYYKPDPENIKKRSELNIGLTQQGTEPQTSDDRHTQQQHTSNAHPSLGFNRILPLHQRQGYVHQL